MPGAAAPNSRSVVSALLSVFAVVLTVLVLLLEATAPGVAWLLAGGFRTTDPALLTLTTQLIRLLAPVVWFLGMAGAAMAVLYALPALHLSCPGHCRLQPGDCGGGAAPGGAPGHLQPGRRRAGRQRRPACVDGHGCLACRGKGSLYAGVAASGAAAHPVALLADRRRPGGEPLPGGAGPAAGLGHRRLQHRVDGQCDHLAADALGVGECCGLIGRAAPIEPLLCRQGRNRLSADAGPRAAAGVAAGGAGSGRALAAWASPSRSSCFSGGPSRRRTRPR